MSITIGYIIAIAGLVLIYIGASRQEEYYKHHWDIYPNTKTITINTWNQTKVFTVDGYYKQLGFTPPQN